MSRKWYQTGIKLKYGCKSIIFRDAAEITMDDHHLIFETAVTCLGDNILYTLSDSGDTITGHQRVTTQFNSGPIYGYDPNNPVLITYKSTDTPRITKVFVKRRHLESFEIIPGY
jgi:hypothetical protein